MTSEAPQMTNAQAVHSRKISSNFWRLKCFTAIRECPAERCAECDLKDAERACPTPRSEADRCDVADLVRYTMYNVSETVPRAPYVAEVLVKTPS